MDTTINALEKVTDPLINNTFADNLEGVHVGSSHSECSSATIVAD